MKVLLINCYYYLMARICKKYQFLYANKIPSLSSYDTFMVRQFLYACLLCITILPFVCFFFVMAQLQSRQYGSIAVFHWYSLYLFLLLILLHDKADKHWNKLLLEEYSSPANTEYYILFSRGMTPDAAKETLITAVVNSVYQ